MESGSENGSFEYPESEFWLKYSTLKKRVNMLKKKNVPLEKYNPIKICGEIGEILNHDEDNLSFLQNKIRKLNTGSELCREVCVLQRHFSNLEINRAVSEILEETKHDKISYRILSKRALDAKREKYFLKQALSTIRNSLRDEETDEETEKQEAMAEASAKIAQPDFESSTGREQMTDTANNVDLPQPEMLRAKPPAESDNADEDLRMSRMSERTGRMTAEKPQPLQDVTIPEISPYDNDFNNFNNELPQLEEILSAQIPEPALDITASGMEKTGGSEDPEMIRDDKTPDLESLSPVITPPKKRRRVKPTFDETIVIPDYVERARRLNESVVNERVQVYEGPPSIVQAFTIRHLLETPAVNNGFFKTVRSSVLERLYRRHQKIQRVPEMPQRSVGLSAAREVQTVQEEACHQKHSEPQKSNITEKESTIIRVEEQLERLIGTPVSKILQREAPPPPVPIGASDPWLPHRSPRIQNLQGTTIEPPIADPWFKPIPQPIPSDKWREFNYVRARLKEVWMEKEAEKRTTIRELLEREGEWNKENMLTLLRVLDKMSLNREIVIDGCGQNINIYPFEIPYVTEKQYSLFRKYPKY